jgi:hypothetical protein
MLGENMGGFAGKICVQVFGWFTWKDQPCNPANIGRGEWAQRDVSCICAECVVESIKQVATEFPGTMLVTIFGYN